MHPSSRTAWYIVPLGLVAILLFVVMVSRPTPAQAQKYYIVEGREACKEALLLISPSIEEDERKRLQKKIDNIGEMSLTPLIVMGEIQHHGEKLSQAKKECLKNLYMSISDLAYLPYAESFAKTEEDRTQIRQRFADDFREAKKNLSSDMATCRKLRSE